MDLTDVRPATDAEIAELECNLNLPVSERGVKDIIDAESKIPALLARIRSDAEVYEGLQQRIQFLQDYAGVQILMSDFRTADEMRAELTRLQTLVRVHNVE